LRDEDIIDSVISVLDARGISATTEVSDARDVLRSTIHFQPPACDGTIEVVLVNINLQEAPLFDKVMRPGYWRQFAYLDRIWLTEDRLGMRLAWIRNKALSIVGLSRFATFRTALAIASPPSCDIAQTIDWSTVWDSARYRRGPQRK
jgi:hypothetical protein